LESPNIRDERMLQRLLEQHPALIGPLGFVEFVSEFPLYKPDYQNTTDLSDLRRRDRADIIAATTSPIDVAYRSANIIELKAAGVEIAERDVGFRLTSEATRAVQQLREYRDWLTRIPQNRALLKELEWDVRWPNLFLIMGRDNEFKRNPGQLEEVRARLLNDGVQLFTVDALLQRAINWSESSRGRHSSSTQEPFGAPARYLILPTGELSVSRGEMSDWNPGVSLERATVLSDLLHRYCLQNLGAQPAGLVLFSGATGSGKTTYLNGVLSRFLNEQHGKLRLQRLRRQRPHVVAIGDPVETYLHGPGQESDDPLFDFTARVMGQDTPALESALSDTLREEPCAVIVSELRSNDEFQAALQFAATGHLILATCHASSLVDAWERLLRVRGGNKPAARADLASRVLTVIHHQVIDGRATDKAKLNAPSVWRGNGRGRRELIVDGLSSLVPTAPDESDRHLSGVLGRYWWTKQLKDTSDHESTWREPFQTHRVDIYQHFLKQARKLDLQGR
jgi:hypothetical protein